jgi:hypothetical protein
VILYLHGKSESRFKMRVESNGFDCITTNKIEKLGSKREGNEEEE